MINFILLYSLLICLTALFINGWFAITRGRWEFKADGTKYWTGKIFNKFHYWLQRHEVKWENYTGNEWMKIFSKFKPFFNDSQIIGFDTNYVLVKKMTERQASLLYIYALDKGLNIRIEEPKENNPEKNMIITAFKEIHIYKMPELLRDPLGMCITCMSSVYGTLAWIFWLLLAKHINTIHPSTSVTVFLEMSWIFKTGLWVLFCIALAYVSTLVFNICNVLNKKS